MLNEGIDLFETSLIRQRQNPLECSAFVASRLAIARLFMLLCVLRSQFCQPLCWRAILFVDHLVLLLP